MKAKQSIVETMAKKALREMLRKACSGEHINASIEGKITEQFYEAANAMASAYAASREFAWDGLIKEFTLCISISASGISTKAKSAPNAITENKDTEEMDLPPSQCNIFTSIMRSLSMLPQNLSSNSFLSLPMQRATIESMPPAPGSFATSAPFSLLLSIMSEQ